MLGEVDDDVEVCHTPHTTSFESQASVPEDTDTSCMEDLGPPHNGLIDGSPALPGDRELLSRDSLHSVGSDGLLSQERDDVVARVSYLETKVSVQEDEIVCLKSALADVIRRLGAVESASQTMHSFLPSKPTPRRSTMPTHRRSTALDNINMAGSSSRSGASHASLRSPRSATSSHSASSASSHQQLSQTKSLPERRGRLFRRSVSHGNLSTRFSNIQGRSVSHGNLLSRFPSIQGSREPVWSPEEASLKMYLKGRAVNMYAPSSIADYNIAKPGEMPSEKLQLEWVYGYRGRDCRSNLYYLPTGELVYFTAAVVVLFNTEEQTQRHYLGHNDDVKCLAVHPDRIRIATGQVAGHDRREGRPHVRIWDSVSLHTLHVLGLGDFDRAVCCISFSTMDSGQHLVAVDEANEHVISVWDLGRDKPHKITETKSSTEPVLAVEFHPSEKGSIVSCGKGQITFWTFEGGALAKKQGVYDKHDKPKYVLCLAFAANGDVLTGDSNGSIIVWGKGTNRITQAVVGAHEGGVFSLCTTKDGNLLSGGGKDRKVIEWDSSYSKTGRETEVGEAYGPVRTLNQGKGGLVLIGTTKNCILQGSLDLEFAPIMQGHTDELWGLASHPSQHQFLTCGSDRNVYLWDSQSRSVVWSKELNDGAHSSCFHPDGHLVAIGTMTARWVVLDLATHEIISVHTDGNEQIECIAYSPDGNYIALGSRDNYIYVYQVSDGGRKYSRVGRCSGHSSFITHLDWSQDSQFIASNSGDYELLYWTASTCKQLTSPSAVRDIQWASQSCTLGFSAAGIWPEGADGTDVNSCNRNHQQSLLATADDFGKVNLYQFPCCQPRSPCHSYKGHSSHVTNVSFLFDDSRLVSTGGRDMAILQWQVV
ncbi:echinoderm microtubule-associated protein-like 2 isoform X4 [Babylonia areolata]|uniref:echinoderm microtubule-associated protein-like 2 isoform X4 n=1 Tax=Babylonia areolata TaxID=304850 RepID=UPI003FD316A2